MRLQGKIFLLFISIALLLGGPLLWTVRQSAHQIDMEELAQKGDLKVSDMADHMAMEFQAGNESSLLPFLQAAQEQTGALYVLAYDTNGRVLAHTNVAEKGQIYRDANAVDELKLNKPDSHLARYQNSVVMEVAAPVWTRAETVSPEDFLLSGKSEPLQKTRLGVIRLGLPVEQVLERERRLFHRIAQILFVTGGAGIFIVFFFMHRMLLPVKWLSSGTLRVAEGEYGISVPVLSKDELGDLAASFNHMSKVLSETTVSKNFLGDILSHMIDPLIVMKTDGTLQMVNQATLDLLGYTKEELEGQHAHVLFLPQHKTSKATEQETLVMKESVRNLELQFVKKSGEGVPVLFSSSVLKNSEEKPTGIIAVAKDVTERKRLEGIIRQSDKMSAVGQLAAGVAHEINNPLGVILGFAQASLRRIQPGETLEMPLKSIEKEAIRCKNLVQDLLTFSRVSKIEREPMDLNHTIKGALSLVAAQAKVARVDVRQELAPDLPRLLGNTNQIQQVIVNLANNAFDAMGGQGVLTIKTESLQEGPLSWICLKVADTGMGIPPEILSRIFDPFFTTKPVGKGTGLGLSLIHEIVEKHSGSIDVKSQPGYTEFCIKFPVRQTHNSHADNVIIKPA